jgi:hypothetical protein
MLRPACRQFDLDYAHNELSPVLIRAGDPWPLGSSLVFPSDLCATRAIELKVWQESGGRGPGILYLLPGNVAPLQRFYLLGTLVATFVPFLHALVDFPFHMPAVVLAVFACVMLFLRNIISLGRREIESDETNLLH